jgi:NAD+ kinase
MTLRRFYLLANPEKREAAVVFHELCEFVRGRCESVGARLSVDGRSAAAAGAEAIVVIGGDGTLIGVARSLGADQVPLIGVNVGKLGFLAEFSVDEFKGSFDRILADPTLIHRRLLLELSVDRGGTAVYRSVLVNDGVVHAGPPFRVVSLAVAIDDQPLTEVTGDGLIVSTPTGSTAYNLSAGGPIMQPGVSAIILTPLSPHSLTHKPIVIESDARVSVTVVRANAGTTCIVDGQATFPLLPADRVILRRFEHDLLLVRNPAHPRWHKLVNRLHWGKSPNYD